jgi:hypothetical protein
MADLDLWQERETELMACLEVISEAKRLGVPVDYLRERTRRLIQEVITLRGQVDSDPDAG